METKTFNPVDYENALWGKDIYTLRGLEVRADILNTVFPQISEGIYSLLDKIDTYKTSYEAATLFTKMNQRVFASWVDTIFDIYNTVIDVLTGIHTYESHEWNPIKLQDRDIIAVSLFGAYKNRTDIDLFDNIDNIFFVTLDLVLDFNMEESAYGVIADYILENIPKYKTSDRKSVLEAIQTVAPKYIIKKEPDAFFKILTDISFIL